MAALILVHVALRGTYWDYSEGVYALIGRLMLHGGQFIVPRAATLHGVEARVQAAARHGSCAA